MINSLKTIWTIRASHSKCLFRCPVNVFISIDNISKKNIVWYLRKWVVWPFFISVTTVKIQTKLLNCIINQFSQIWRFKLRVSDNIVKRRSGCKICWGSRSTSWRTSGNSRHRVGDWWREGLQRKNELGSLLQDLPDRDWPVVRVRHLLPENRFPEVQRSFRSGRYTRTTARRRRHLQI